MDTSSPVESPARRTESTAAGRARRLPARIATVAGTLALLAMAGAQSGAVAQQRLGQPLDNRIDSAARQTQDQPIDSNAEVGTSLLGTTLDSTLIDPRINQNERVDDLPPRERGDIAEERSGRIDEPERARPITR